MKNKLEFYLHKTNKAVHFQVVDQDFERDFKMKLKNGIDIGDFTFKICDAVELRKNIVYLRGADQYYDWEISSKRFLSNDDRDKYYDSLLDSLKLLMKSNEYSK